VPRARRTLAAVFAGDRRVWRAAALCGLPLLALIAFYCVRPRDYFTGSNSVEAYTYVAPAAAGQRLCVPGLEIPAGTARIRLQLLSRTALRPRLELELLEGGRTIRSELAPVRVSAGSRSSFAEFPIPTQPSQPASRPATACLTAAELVNWGGTPLPAPPPEPPTLAGAPLSGRISIWYQPPQGSQRSYLGQLGSILDRAALFRPSPVGAWTYWLILFAALPLLALAAVRLLALAAAGRMPRRILAWLYVLAVVNFVCWALLTPPFQAPDEVDHFAYTQSLVERGERPSQGAVSPLQRWSGAEALALEDTSFFTDHQVGDSTPPWLAAQERRYEHDVTRLHPSAANGGGNETAATHGPIYYAALAPAYLAAGSGVFAQLTLMRLVSALIGALTVVFAFLLVRELVPGRQWPAVLAALLVAFEPMYGFISGAVNNDVGANAGAAALELLLIRVLRRGLTVRTGALLGALLVLLPLVKGTVLSLYPLAVLVLIASLWRRHGRAQAPGWAALAGVAGVAALVRAGILSAASTATQATGAAGPAPAPAVSDTSSVSLALHHLPGYFSYVWEVFLPRLPFMHAHFVAGELPAYVIFVERGWGAFGWYTVYFPQGVYAVITTVMLLAIPLALWAARREWAWVRANWISVVAVLLMPVFVIAGFEAAFYTPSLRPVISEFGRYLFPAIAPLAAFVVGALHAFGRRRAVLAGAALLAAMIALSVASQLLTLTAFYA
jgi:4-amino-4-deoxy-L-arabinose transferase-like glycosyltransferase